MTSSKRLTIAMQKSGRLSDDTQALLKRCGLKLNLQDGRLLAHVANMPIDIMRVRSSDIPGLVMDGVCDIGIVGDNTLEEAALERKLLGSNCEYIRTKGLNFGGCRLSLAMPEEFNYQGIESLNGLRFATTYPQLLKRYAQENNIDIDFCLLKGSVEVAPRVGLADGICDLVSTGTTLKSNGLKAVVNILNSESVLAQTASPLLAEKKEIIDRLMKRVNGVILASETKYIMMNAPKNSLEKIKEIVPGMEEPSVMPLSNDFSRIAIHAVVKENVFWETMETLKEAGASSILVLPIEKIVL